MIKKAPEISVIIPAYNAEKHIVRAIESVLLQTFPALEIIVVDDGSTDSTSDVIKSFGKKVRYLSQINAGPARARNCGIENARGNYIAFLDSDDVWKSDHLEQFSIAYTKYEIINWYSSGYHNEQTGKDALIPGHNNKYLIVDFFTEQATHYITHTNTVIIKRDILLNFAGFNEEMTYGEDIDLWFRMGVKYPEIHFYNGVTAVYAHNAQSLVNTRTKDFSEDFYKRINRTIDTAGVQLLDRKQVFDPILCKWLRKLLLRCFVEGNRHIPELVTSRFACKLRIIDNILIILNKYLPRMLVTHFILFYKKTS